jgi:tetratricopeptide (TPR) repeat protein
MNAHFKLSIAWRAAWLAGALVAASHTARAQAPADRILRTGGVDSGQITAITPLGVTISKSGVESTVSVENVEAVTFGGEPPELTSARNAYLAGRIDDAAEAIGAASKQGVAREEILADLEFYAAAIKARQALAGQGTIEAALGDVRGFMAARGKSFHIPAALELLGDLHVAAGQYGNARTEYAKLAKAKSSYFALRSALLVGRAWQAEGDHAQAQAEFDRVLAASDASALLDPLKQAATLERAVAQAAGGQADAAATTIGEIIAKARPDDHELLARAYNALGDCYLASNDARGALFCFLHVDLLYNQDAETHAAALRKLVDLWKAIGRDSRSEEAAARLAQKYPNSRRANP